MTTPTDEYLEQKRLAKEILDKINLGGLETRFEASKPLPVEEGMKVATELPDHITFIGNGEKVGELYFTRTPVEVITLRDSFDPIAKQLRIKYKLK